MSKITNVGITRSGTGCFIAVGYPGQRHMATVGVKGLTKDSEISPVDADGHVKCGVTVEPVRRQTAKRRFHTRLPVPITVT